MKNLLVLSYYFPPLGMSGVQRTLKFVKYLPQFGWRPLVITPSHRGSYGYDPGLLDEARGAAIRRTFSLDPLFLSPHQDSPQPASRRGALARQASAWFLPDNKVGWIPFAVNAALNLSRTVPISVIYSTAPPYSSHLAAAAIKRRLGLPLVCDFRDAWTRYTWATYPTPLHRMIDQRLETSVVRASDLVLAVNQPMIEELRGAHPDIREDRFRLLPHGYDPEDFSHRTASASGDFLIVHSGTFLNNRGPAPLLAALGMIREQRPDLFAKVKVAFVGAFRPGDRQLVEKASLSECISFTGYLPHAQAVRHLSQASILWLVMGPEETVNVTPGKLFEYFGAGKPILASVPLNGAAADLIRETGAGWTFSPGDAEGLMNAICRLADLWQRDQPLYQPDPQALAQYDRREITRRLASLLDGLAP